MGCVAAEASIPTLALAPTQVALLATVLAAVRRLVRLMLVPLLVVLVVLLLLVVLVVVPLIFVSRLFVIRRAWLSLAPPFPAVPVSSVPATSAAVIPSTGNATVHCRVFFVLMGSNF